MDDENVPVSDEVWNKTPKNIGRVHDRQQVECHILRHTELDSVLLDEEERHERGRDKQRECDNEDRVWQIFEVVKAEAGALGSVLKLQAHHHKSDGVGH